jgi:NADH-quinone oxidoreductase subunit C
VSQASKSIPRSLTDLYERHLGGRVEISGYSQGVVSLDVDSDHWLEVCRTLRDEPEFDFGQLTDLCGLDFLGFGGDEWDTEDATRAGFSRGVEGLGPGRFDWASRPESTELEQRFAVVAHLLSIRNNMRVRLRTFAKDEGMPVLPSLVEVWAVADWYEREAFDLFGIVFEGHSDLRRILTDYGFTGHPFRKDFPLIGNVTVRYDATKKRVVYEPVEIEPRVLVPRVLRDDSRYKTDELDLEAGARASILLRTEYCALSWNWMARRS